MGAENSKSSSASTNNLLPTTNAAPTVIPITLASFTKTGPTPIETAMVRMRMDPRILDLLQRSAALSTTDPDSESESEELTDEQHKARGFFGPLNDGRHMPAGHRYHEGYFHADANGAKAAALEESMNPRFGSPMSKPAAPLELRAFLRAFKEVNREAWLAPLVDELGVEMINFESAFADVAAQSHYGEEVKISPEEIGGWHFDAPNSLLHLAISVHGERKLHVSHHQFVPAAASDKKKEEGEDDDANGVEKADTVVDRHSVAEMVPGDVYLTSPSAFNHAVEYPACSWANRILALQCRTLVPSRSSLQRDRTVDWDQKAAMVGEKLLTAKIRLPTFEEVTKAMEEVA